MVSPSKIISSSLFLFLFDGSSYQNYMEINISMINDFTNLTGNGNMSYLTGYGSMSYDSFCQILLTLLSNFKNNASTSYFSPLFGIRPVERRSFTPLKKFLHHTTTRAYASSIFLFTSVSPADTSMSCSWCFQKIIVKCMDKINHTSNP